jgi:hypothetical protein
MPWSHSRRLRFSCTLRACSGVAIPAQRGRKVDADSRELTCTSKNLSTKMIEGLSNPSEAKEPVVTITACEENLRLKMQKKPANQELKSLTKVLGECCMLLAQLKQDARPECQAAHKEYSLNLVACQNLCEQVINSLGCAKALSPEDKEGSATLLEDLKKQRSQMFSMINGIKEAKTQVRRLLTKPAVPAITA